MKLNHALVQMGCAKQEMPVEPDNRHWIIYELLGEQMGEPPLIVAAYQWTNRGGNFSTIEHIFTNDPQKTRGKSMEELLTDTKHTATAISDSHIYHLGRSDAGAALLNLFAGMIGGAAAGFVIGTGVVSTLSRYFGIELPPHSALIPAGSGGLILGVYMAEKPEAHREMRAAKLAIELMICPPATFLHGVPAVAVIEQYMQRLDASVTEGEGKQVQQR